MDNTIWGNENPDGNLEEHEEDCKCISCSLKREEASEYYADQMEDR